MRNKKTKRFGWSLVHFSNDVQIEHNFRQNKNRSEVFHFLARFWKFHIQYSVFEVIYHLISTHPNWKINTAVKGTRRAFRIHSARKRLSPHAPYLRVFPPFSLEWQSNISMLIKRISFLEKINFEKFCHSGSQGFISYQVKNEIMSLIRQAEEKLKFISFINLTRPANNFI